MRRAVFLDRDGVIVENRSNYVRSWEDIEFLPGAIDALHALATTDYLVVVVTNQSAIGRGIISSETAVSINDRMRSVVEAGGGRIDAVYMCPHHPGEGCECRKPKPGMLTQAADEFAIDLSDSYLVGDALSDVAAASAVSVLGLLVLTGRGSEQASTAALAGCDKPPTFLDLDHAVRHILGHPRSH